MKGGLTYREAGVDMAAMDDFKSRIAVLASGTYTSAVLKGVGGFACAVAIDPGSTDPTLMVAATDGVGTKLTLACQAGRHDGIGVDLVAMCVNDVITTGATPSFFLDYLAFSRVSPRVMDAVLRSIAEGCRQAECALAGGETAQMPKIYRDDEYELAGFAVGTVRRSALVDGSSCEPGDVLVGLSSSGLHSNGFSLVRLLLERSSVSLDRYVDDLGRTVGEAFLTPTIIYWRPVKAVLERLRPKAMAHVTGGGIAHNLARVLPKGCRAIVRRATIPPHPVFDFVRSLGVQEDEMWRVFNMGVGYVFVVSPEQVDLTMELASHAGCDAFVLGELVEGELGVVVG